MQYTADRTVEVVISRMLDCEADILIHLPRNVEALSEVCLMFSQK